MPLNKTSIYCKSDCEFSIGEDRMCSLADINLVQLSPTTPKFTCAQYVRRMDGELSFKLRYRLAEKDIEKARMYGA